MKRRITMVLLIIFSFILQSTLLKIFSIASVGPNLGIVLVVSFALMRGKREGIFVGFLFGMLMDLFYGPALGFNALIYAYIGYFNGHCYRIFYDDDIKMPVIMTALSDLAYGIVIYGIEFLFRGRIHFFYYFGRIIIPEAIFTVIITLICYKLLLALNNKLEKSEKRSVGSIV